MWPFSAGEEKQPGGHRGGSTGSKGQLILGSRAPGELASSFSSSFSVAVEKDQQLPLCVPLEWKSAVYNGSLQWKSAVYNGSLIWKSAAVDAMEARRQGRNAVVRSAQGALNLAGRRRGRPHSIIQLTFSRIAHVWTAKSARCSTRKHTPMLMAGNSESR